MENRGKIKLPKNIQFKLSVMNIIGLFLVIFGLPGIVGLLIYGIGSLILFGIYPLPLFGIGVYLLYRSNKIKKIEIEKNSKLL